jgi:hypothetical protein
MERAGSLIALDVRRMDSSKLYYLPGAPVQSSTLVATAARPLIREAQGNLGSRLGVFRVRDRPLAP